MRAAPIVGLVLGFASLAALANAAPQLDVQKACRADTIRLCSGVRPGGGRLSQCLNRRLGQASDACRSEMRAHRAIVREQISDRRAGRR
jgi:hypothetical protein